MPDEEVADSEHNVSPSAGRLSPALLRCCPGGGLLWNLVNKLLINYNPLNLGLLPPGLVEGGRGLLCHLPGQDDLVQSPRGKDGGGSHIT